jgi:hypothetical protein
MAVRNPLPPPYIYQPFFLRFFLRARRLCIRKKGVINSLPCILVSMRIAHYYFAALLDPCIFSYSEDAFLQQNHARRIYSTRNVEEFLVAIIPSHKGIEITSLLYRISCSLIQPNRILFCKPEKRYI